MKIASMAPAAPRLPQRLLAIGERSYRVYADGTVISLARAKPHRLKPWTGTDEHLYLNLGRSCRMGLHQIVMLAFKGECPIGKEVCHKDGDAFNNSVSNLYYGTRKQNMEDYMRHTGRRQNMKFTYAEIEVWLSMWRDSKLPLQTFCRSFQLPYHILSKRK